MYIDQISVLFFAKGLLETPTKQETVEILAETISIPSTLHHKGGFSHRPNNRGVWRNILQNTKSIRWDLFKKKEKSR
jgi:hypothetical protein